MNFDLRETVNRRKSVRSYEKRPLSQSDREAISAVIADCCTESTLFPAEIQIRLLEAKPGTDTEKFGTYGVIRGAQSFLGVTVKNTETAPEAAGYAFEKLVLRATAMGLGTCWMAGTFNREQFAGLLGVKEDELFPVISPIGYPLEKKALIDSVFRKVGKSDQRKAWSELFFAGAFGKPLSEALAGDYAFPLEMLRLAPSAANKQPWRIVRKDGAFHFFRVGNLKSKYPYDLQRLDVGIGACHFHLAAQERGLAGEFAYLPVPDIALPENVKYLFSWVEG